MYSYSKKTITPLVIVFLLYGSNMGISHLKKDVYTKGRNTIYIVTFYDKEDGY
jgi:hypothetical protein